MPLHGKASGDVDSVAAMRAELLRRHLEQCLGGQDPFWRPACLQAHGRRCYCDGVAAATSNGIDAIEHWLQEDCSFSLPVCFENENLPASGVGKVTRCINKRNAASVNESITGMSTTASGKNGMGQII